MFAKGDLVKITDGVWDPEIVQSNRIGIIIGVLKGDSDSYYEILLNNGMTTVLHSAYIKHLYESPDENTS